MEGLTDILPHISGLPWVATFIIVLFTLACSKGIDALLKWRKSNLEERQYDDNETKMAREALVKELRERIEKLEKAIDVLQTTYREERITSSRLLSEERAAHAKCEISMAELKGDMRVMQEKVKRLEKHDEVNKEQIELSRKDSEELKDAVKMIDQSAKLP